VSAAESERTLELSRQSSAVDDARRFAEHLVGVCTPECREAVTLAVCELGENLVKYSARDAPHAGTIGVSIDGARVRVRAKNRVCSPEDAAAVAAIVTRITHSDIQELYRARLAELFANPDLPRAQLGLLRLAFEGGFQLSCSVQGHELQIVAERPCKNS
jgi:hypothetical protein